MRPDWTARNREAVEEVRRQAARQLAKPGGNRHAGLRALAEKLGISRQAVSLWEDRIPVAHVPKIKDILGIPMTKQRGDVFARRGGANAKPNGKRT